MRSLIFVIAAVAISTFVGDACGDANKTRGVTRDARVGGSVRLCRTNFGRCTRLATVVTIVSVRGTALGSAVARQYARRGQFTFLLVPGKYFPAVRGSLIGARCISGEVSVRANENVRDDVTCYLRVRGHRTVAVH